MASDVNQRLADLAYTERAFARVMAQAAERIADPEVRDLTKQVAEDHRRQASELDDIVSSLGGANGPSESAQHAAISVERRVNNSADQGGMIAALTDFERDDAALHHDLLKRPELPRDVLDRLQAQDAEETEHVNFFENRAPAMAPDIYGSQRIPPKGFGAF